MNLKELIRNLFGRLPAGLLVLLALAGFWVLSQGMASGRGSVVAYAEELLHNVGPLQAGRLHTVEVQLGHTVHRGDVVARMDTRQLELQRELLHAELLRAMADLAAQQDQQSALLQRGQLQAVRMHANEERARAELHELDQQVTRLSKLDAAHLVHASELEAARQRQHALSADLQSRPAGNVLDLELMGLRPRSQEDLARRLQERLAPYHAAIDVKKAALRQLAYAIEEMTLRAPVDGQIAAILQRPGDVVSAGTPILQIITMRPGHIVAFIPERQISGFVSGARVKVRRAGLYAPALRGHVTELSPHVEEVPLRARPTPTVPLWARRMIIKLDAEAPLLPGEAFHVSAY